jgi:hypothetical protein
MAPSADEGAVRHPVSDLDSPGVLTMVRPYPDTFNDEWGTAGRFVSL